MILFHNILLKELDDIEKVIQVAGGPVVIRHKLEKQNATETHRHMMSKSWPRKRIFPIWHLLITVTPTLNNSLCPFLPIYELPIDTYIND